MKYIVSLVMLTLCAAMAWCEEIPFNGLIVDGQGNPVNKAKIWITDEASYASTDKRGRFGLSEVNPGDTLNVKIKKNVFRIAVDGRKQLKSQSSRPA